MKLEKKKIKGYIKRYFDPRFYKYCIKEYVKNFDTCQELKRYKNLHKGQRCFIIGTGPSLKVCDLEMIKDEISFGSNRIFEIFDKTSWRPTYYINQDLKVIEKFSDEIREIKVRRKFLQVEAKSLFDDEKDISYFLLPYLKYYPRKAVFSKHVNRFIGQGFTVTYGAIQLAYYMGFREVYLLGIDHNYSISLDANGIPVVDNAVKDYFEGSTASNIGMNLPRVAESTLAYLTASSFCKTHNNFQVYNATRGGKLEAFPRVDFDSIVF